VWMAFLSIWWTGPSQTFSLRRETVRLSSLHETIFPFGSFEQTFEGSPTGTWCCWADESTHSSGFHWSSTW
jgi:hypothetical protein